MSEIEKVIEKNKEETEGIIANDPILEYFDKATNFLDYENILEKENKESKLEAFKKECNLVKLVDEIDSGNVSEQLEFYFGGDNTNFFMNLLSLNPNSEFFELFEQ